MKALRYILPLAILFASGCDYDRFEPIEIGDKVEWIPNADLADIRRSFNVATTIQEEIIVAGHVTTSDEAGNFYRTLVIEDATGALELMIGMDYLYRTYPIGSRLIVRLQGLAIDEFNGVLRVGLQPEQWDYHTTSYMSHAAVADRYIHRTPALVAPKPTTLAAGELTQRLCGRLVTIAGVQADDVASTWADGNYTCYRKFRDLEGDSIYVQTSPYARFASQTPPQEEVSLMGVLYYGAVEGSRQAFIIKICDETAVAH